MQSFADRDLDCVLAAFSADNSSVQASTVQYMYRTVPSTWQHRDIPADEPGRWSRATR